MMNTRLRGLVEQSLGKGLKMDAFTAYSMVLFAFLLLLALGMVFLIVSAALAVLREMRYRKDEAAWRGEDTWPMPLQIVEDPLVKGAPSCMRDDRTHVSGADVSVSNMEEGE